MLTREVAPGFGFLLTVLMLGQGLGTMATSILPAVAPKVVESYAISPALIGYQVSLISLAMLVSLSYCGNLSLRWGGSRTGQVGVALVALGCVVAVLPHPAFMLLSALPMGLGYGLVSPSASHVMMRFTPADRRNLIFSVKQTGVPLGGAAAAVLAPAIAIGVGWRWALIFTALSLVALILAMQRGRLFWDSDRRRDAPLSADPFGGLRLVWRDRALRLLGFAGAAFVVMQTALLTFTVIFFVDEVKLGLVAAGLVLLASQIGGVAGRLFWGWVADRLRNCLAMIYLTEPLLDYIVNLCKCYIRKLSTGYRKIISH